jgi:hypothetical protein
VLRDDFSKRINRVIRGFAVVAFCDFVNDPQEGVRWGSERGRTRKENATCNILGYRMGVPEHANCPGDVTS